MIVATGIWTSLAGAVAYLALAVGARRVAAAVQKTLLLLACALHGVSIFAGFGAQHFGFAQALSLMAWLVALVYLVESRLLPQLKARWALAGLGAFVLLLSIMFPGVAVVPTGHAPLLDLHWALGMASYALFACAVLHAWLSRSAEARLRASPQTALQAGDLPVLTLERLMFGFVIAGFLTLSATLLAGMIFSGAVYGPGHGWRWTHKSIFALLSWLVFAVLLLGRWRLGWRGRTAAQMLYIGAAFLLLSYVGSHFVLDVLLNKGGP